MRKMRPVGAAPCTEIKNNVFILKDICSKINNAKLQ